MRTRKWSGSSPSKIWTQSWKHSNRNAIMLSLTSSGTWSVRRLTMLCRTEASTSIRKIMFAMKYSRRMIFVSSIGTKTRLTSDKSKFQKDWSVKNDLVGLWRAKKPVWIRQKRNQRYFLVRHNNIFKSTGMALTEKALRTRMNRNLISGQTPTMTTFMRIVSHNSYHNTCGTRRKIGKNQEQSKPLRLKSLTKRKIRKTNRVRHRPRRASRVRDCSQDEECRPWWQAPTVETLSACKRFKRKRDSSDKSYDISRKGRKVKGSTREAQSSKTSRALRTIASG